MRGGREKKIILTGFEPFGGMAVNPSWEGVRLVPDHIGSGASGGARIIKLRLPVVFGKAYEILENCMNETCPDGVILTGLAGGRQDVTPEVIAVNVMDARIADNSGFKPQWERIDPAGPDGLFSTLPNLELIGAVNDAGISASLSFSAGTFVCNDLFYRTMAGIAKKGLSAPFPAGFIPVPDMEPARIAKTLKTCLNALSEYIDRMNNI